MNLMIKKEFCAPQIVEGNTCLDYIQCIMFPWFKKFKVHNSEENGGKKKHACEKMSVLFPQLFFVFCFSKCQLSRFWFIIVTFFPFTFLEFFILDISIWSLFHKLLFVSILLISHSWPNHPRGCEPHKMSHIWYVFGSGAGPGSQEVYATHHHSVSHPRKYP